MSFVKRTDCVLYEVGTECLNVCYVKFEVQEFNALWTEDYVDCSGENTVFFPHTAYLCNTLSYGSHSKYQLYPKITLIRCCL